MADSYQAVVEDPDIDAVYIPLPNSLHGAMDARRPRGREARAVREALHRQRRGGPGRGRGRRSGGQALGLVVAEAFHYRYHPLARRMREIVTAVSSAPSSTSRRGCAPRSSTSRTSGISSSLAGGAMMDMGCYVVNMARMLGGEEPTVVSARPSCTIRTIDRAMSAELRFPSGASATVHCSMWSSSLLRLAARVTGDAVRCGVQSDRPPVRQLGDRAIRTAPAATRSRPDGPPMTTSWTRSARPSSEGARLTTTAEDAVANMTVIDAVYRAANMRPRGS